MIPIPRWALPVLRDFPCPRCGAEKQESNVLGIGVRERRGVDIQNNSILTLDYYCPECNSLYQLIVDPDDSAASISNILRDILDTLEQNDGKREKKPRNKLSKSSISIKEVRELRRILKESVSFVDFLHQIGVTPEYIKKLEDEIKNDPKPNKD
jgi:transcription elongation factor Elf1